ncbi:MAG: hypothetical protein COB35_10720 [Gammaproteobacteria bacterium]|nr:MAG: hypothetical protein COB35_10720 [Gammaproteobacteria bacterium]
MNNNIATAFYDAMFGESDYSRDKHINKLEQKALDNVREILNSPKLLSSHIPSLPAILVKLINTLKDPNADFLEISGIIEQDPPLALQVLKVANSPAYFRGNSEICSLRKAVSLLGVTGVANIATTIMMEKIRPERPIYYKLFGKQIWRHSVHCAFLCQTIANDTRCDEFDEFDAHFLGLIHDVGKIIVFNCLCEALSTNIGADNDQPGSSVFKEVMSEMSTDISIFVAKEWQLPKMYCDALSQQHSKRTTPLAKLLFDANAMCEVFLLFEKKFIGEPQLTKLRRRFAINDQNWQRFIEAVDEMEATL